MGIFNFSDIKTVNISEFGGKCANLIKMLQAGFNVPNGFVISISEKDIQKNEIMSAFDDLGAKYVAVRSSAVAEDGKSDAWAGQLETCLNTNREDLLNNIKKCRESINSLQAVAYKNQKGLNQSQVAVIAQEMIESDVSGVAFSINPINNANTIVVEAGKGLGEAIVSGKTTPDNYEVSKDTFEIKSKQIETQTVKLTREGWQVINDNSQKLSDTQIIELAKEVSKIEKFYGFAVDVEWAFVGNKLYILQSRPITAVSNTKTQSLPDIAEYELTFKVNGLPFMFADLLCRGFGYLHPLFVIDKGEFLQYFPNEMMSWADEYGYNTFGSPMGFVKHKNDFTEFHNKAFPHLQKILTEPLSRKNVAEFFDIIYQYFVFYSKTDYQFTNKLYVYANKNPNIAQSIRDISVFKDIARIWINNVTINDDCLLNRLLAQLSQKFNVDDLSNYKMNEILSLFDGEKPTDIKERELGAVVSFDGTNYHYAFGQEAIDYANRIHLYNSFETKTDIKGQTANRGQTQFVEGKARLIKVDYSDLAAVKAAIDSMQNDEILVAEFTAPELTLACEKAKAIVTDMGGMLSHAAIISRELGIPCIVGTSFASHRIQNGDTIFLDMNTGNVTVK
ncbi:hypothetical protein FACS189421_12570 [Bacteroidia bacterium]|nr:hypothetical protein FACS189421_12570 [Bacteroidia bacterium]